MEIASFQMYLCKSDGGAGAGRTVAIHSVSVLHNQCRTQTQLGQKKKRRERRIIYPTEQLESAENVLKIFSRVRRGRGGNKLPSLSESGRWRDTACVVLLCMRIQTVSLWRLELNKTPYGAERGKRKKRTGIKTSLCFPYCSLCTV